MTSEATHQAREAATGVAIATHLRAAHTHWTRLKGLLGTRSLEPGEGLWIKPCNQVHMIGMRYAVDVVFLDDTLRVVRTIDALAPGRLSPKVTGANSVLELPVGTVARARIAEGVQVEIEGESDPGSDSRVDAAAIILCNLAIAALYAFFAAAHFSAARRTGHWATTLPIVVQEALLVVLFLVRRRPLATSHRPSDWIVGIIGTGLPMLLRPTDHLGALQWLGEPAQIVGVLLALAGITFLGRSIAVVAANRGIKTQGLYRVVRHPMYAAYTLTYLGYSASHPTWRNCLITAGAILALNVRAIAEERFLAQDPGYREYARQVRWRFVPYLF